MGNCISGSMDTPTAAGFLMARAYLTEPGTTVDKL